MSAETSPDLHTTAGKAQVLGSRRSEAAGKRQEAVDKQHARGKMTAMERIDAFLDADSFQAIDGLTRHRSHNFGLENHRPYGDGVIPGMELSMVVRCASLRRISPFLAVHWVKCSVKKLSKLWIWR